MQINEFISLGCIQCGYHDFTSTGPIESDGPTELSCTRCERAYSRGEIGNYDSFSWESARKQELGEVFEPPNTVRYQNEEQFIEKFVESVEGD